MKGYVESYKDNNMRKYTFYQVYVCLYTNCNLHKKSYHGILFIVESLILSTVLDTGSQYMFVE